MVDHFELSDLVHEVPHGVLQLGDLVRQVLADRALRRAGLAAVGRVGRRALALGELGDLVEAVPLADDEVLVGVLEESVAARYFREPVIVKLPDEGGDVAVGEVLAEHLAREGGDIRDNETVRDLVPGDDVLEVWVLMRAGLPCTCRKDS